MDKDSAAAAAEVELTIREDEEGKGEEEEGTETHLSFWGVVIILLTFSTAGAMVTYPYAMGLLGKLLGPALLVLWTVCVLFTNLMMAEAARKCKATTFGDVGEFLAGKRGRHLATGFQMANLLFFLPVVLDLSGGALQYLFEESGTKCVGVYTAVCFLFALLSAQMFRSYSSSVWLSYLSVLLLCVKGFILLPYIFVETSNPNSPSPSAEFAMAPPSNTLTWADYSGALSMIPYSFTPIFILIETQSEMRNPEQIEGALFLTAGFSILTYLVPGLLGVAEWGWNINNPVTDGLDRGIVSDMANFCLLFASLNDYLLANLAISRETQLRLLPSMNVRQINVKTISQWLLLTSIPGLFALVLATSIPSFGTLVGLLTSLTIVLSNTSIPEYFMLEKRRRATGKASSKALNRGTSIILGVGVSGFLLAG